MIEKMKIGKDFRHVGFVDSLAYLFWYIAEYERSEKLYEKQLKIYMDVLEENNINIAEIYNNLADVCLSQRKNEMAIALCERSLQIYEELFGQNSLKMAHIYLNMVIVYMSHQEEYEKEEFFESQRKYEIILLYYFKAYKAFSFSLGLNHSDTQVVYDNMEIAYTEWNPEGNFEQWLEEKMKE